MSERQQVEKWGEHQLSEIMMGQISEDLIGSIKDFDLYSKTNGKLCMLFKQATFCKGNWKIETYFFRIGALGKEKYFQLLNPFRVIKPRYYPL